VNEDQIVFHHRRGLVYIHLFADDAIASGFAAYLIDVVNSFAGSYSLRAVSQLLWSDKDREVWFSLEENHEKAYRFGLTPIAKLLSHVQSYHRCVIE
jgi:hypothetical protein